MKLRKLPILMLAALALAAQTARAATLTVTTTADSGPGSLREAITLANQQAGPDTITFNLGPGAHTINLAGPLPWLETDINIHGPGADLLTVRRDSTNEFRIFTILDGSTVGVAGMTVTNGTGYNTTVANGSAGGIFNAGTLAIANCVISGNLAGQGGAIANRGTLTVADCTVSGNAADALGGGIFNDHGTVQITGSTLGDNTAFGFFGGAGGGIYSDGGTVSVSGSTLSGNNAYTDPDLIAGSGGGIYNGFGSTLIVSNSILIENHADVSGGGILNLGALAVSNSTLNNNSAHVRFVSVLGDGGGIFNAGTLNLANSTLSGNSAPDGGGGAIVNYFDQTVAIQNCTISGNTAYGAGGIVNFGLLTLNNSTLAGNTATGSGQSGGGILSSVSSTVSVSHCTIAANACTAEGGGIYSFGVLQINNSIVAINSAPSFPDVGSLFTGSFNFIGQNQPGVDPMLGPLTDNGGPTLTMALLPGSPCINAGDPAFVGPPYFDQRGPGFPRVQGSRLDIGAFEAPADSDGDGVPDPADQCPGTSPGDIVDASGCSIAQLVPCAGPRSGGAWKNHGEYVSTVAKAAQAFLSAGLITQAEKDAIVRAAAQSDCGK